VEDDGTDKPDHQDVKGGWDQSCLPHNEDVIPQQESQDQLEPKDEEAVIEVPVRVYEGNASTSFDFFNEAAEANRVEARPDVQGRSRGLRLFHNKFLIISDKFLLLIFESRTELVLFSFILVELVQWFLFHVRLLIHLLVLFPLEELLLTLEEVVSQQVGKACDEDDHFSFDPEPHGWLAASQELKEDYHHN